MNIQEIESDGVYKATVCNRCGDVILRKHISTDLLNGITRVDHFENAPEGWEYHTNTGMLCPKCNDEYEKCIKNFMESGKTKAEEINDQ